MTDLITRVGSNGMTIPDPPAQLLTVNHAMPQVALAPVGGLPPYSFGVYQGTLPQGIGIDVTTGIVAGTPSLVTGNADVSFFVTDYSGGRIATNGIEFQVKSFITSLAPASTALTSDEYATVNIPSIGGYGDSTIEVYSGTLPPGMKISGDSVIGAPTTPGTYNVIFNLLSTEAEMVTITGVVSFVVS